jgi:phage FluMu protein gp41
MATIEFKLQKGIVVGDVANVDVVLRDPTAGDVIDSNVDAEKVVLVPIGVDGSGQPVVEPQLVVSPTLVAINVLRRQIVSIGTISGPLERNMIDKLSPADINLMHKKAEELEKASMEVTQRGRSDGESEDNPPGD